MRKSSLFILGATLSFAFIYSTQTQKVAFGEGGLERSVYIGGMSAGFNLKTGSAQVIGTCEVLTEQGACSPALKAGLRVGDNICKVGGISVESITELNEIVHKSQGKALDFVVERGGTNYTFEIQPVKDKLTGKYKIGVLVRDTVSGIGTITYIDKQSGRFGSLGHSVVGEDKREMRISDGAVYECNIIGVNKGMRGKAGELRGMFLNEKLLGNAEKICDSGIYGQISTEFVVDELMSVVASSSTVKPGSACIYSTIDGVERKKYQIEIVKVDKYNKENKNFVLKITDEELIAQTGGIVQGMSGSPIIQDGKMVGAVTHVFLNDPTRGYGIDIQRMLKE